MIRSDKVQGVYCITHIDSGKMYIGSSVDVAKRWNQHLRSLRSGKHHSSHLQRAWNRYGESSFYFSVLERVTDRSFLHSIEQAWIEVYDVCKETCGYNTAPKCLSQEGVVRTEEFKSSVSDSMRKVWGSTEKRERMSIQAKEYWDVPDHRKKQSEKKRVYFSNSYNRKKQSDRLSEYYAEPGIRSACSAKHAKKWVVTDPTGADYTVFNLKRFCVENGLNQGHMVQVARGNLRHYKNWMCRYA